MSADKSDCVGTNSLFSVVLLQHTVSRVGLLDQAEKLIGDLGSSQSVLEIQYEGEVRKHSRLRALHLLLSSDVSTTCVLFMANGCRVSSTLS